MGVDSSAAWLALNELAQSGAGQVHMEQLFAEDPHRSARYSLHVDDLFLDYSKTGFNNRLWMACLPWLNSRILSNGFCVW